MQGRDIVIKKPINGCQRVFNMAVCCCITPFAGVLSCLTCCQREETYAPCLINFCASALDRFYLEEGFIGDAQKTQEIRDQDFKELGFTSNTQEGFRELVKSGRYKIIQSSTCPQHCYTTFFGPVSRFSYVIIIPNGDVDGQLIFRTVFKKGSGFPSNTESVNEQAEILCRGYRPGMNKVTIKKTAVLAGTVNISTNYGAIRGQEYRYEERVVS